MNPRSQDGLGSVLGKPGGRLWDELGVHRAIGGVVYSANTLESPGVVRNTSPGRNWLQIGEPTGSKSVRLKKNS